MSVEAILRGREHVDDSLPDVLHWSGETRRTTDHDIEYRRIVYGRFHDSIPVAYATSRLVGTEQTNQYRARNASWSPGGRFASGDHSKLYIRAREISVFF